VEEIAGENMVEKVVLKNVRTGEVSDLPVSGVFVFTGMDPNASFVKGVVESAGNGWILTNERMETNVEGIFAAGDVREKFLRQVVTAAGDGATAAMAASSYVSEQLHIQSLLLEPEHVIAYIFSSIDEGQARLAADIEKLASASRVVQIDGYKNKRMVEKLGIAKLPSLVEFKRGKIARSEFVQDGESAKKFLS
jgi:thioredoxin reductase (NADPH)